jgi:hypothetical protein
MPKFSEPSLELEFDLPEKPTVRQMLAYDSAVFVDHMGDATLIRLWHGAVEVVQNWKCPISIDVNLDGEIDPKTLEMVKYVGLMAFSWAQGIKEAVVPKN